MLQGVAKESEFERYLPAFEQMAATLQFDEGHGFKIPAAKPAGSEKKATQAVR